MRCRCTHHRAGRRWCPSVPQPSPSRGVPAPRVGRNQTPGTPPIWSGSLVTPCSATKGGRTRPAIPSRTRSNERNSSIGNDDAYPSRVRTSSRVADTAIFRGGWLGPRHGPRKGSRPSAPTKLEARVATSTTAMGHDAVCTSGRSDMTMPREYPGACGLRPGAKRSLGVHGHTIGWGGPWTGGGYGCFTGKGPPRDPGGLDWESRPGRRGPWQAKDSTNRSSFSTKPPSITTEP